VRHGHRHGSLLPASTVAKIIQRVGEFLRQRVIPEVDEPDRITIRQARAAGAAPLRRSDDLSETLAKLLAQPLANRPNALLRLNRAAKTN